MKKLFIIFLIALCLILYYSNSYTNGWLLNIAMQVPQYIAFIIAVIAIMFPRDYHLVPDLITKNISGNGTILKQLNDIPRRR